MSSYKLFVTHSSIAFLVTTRFAVLIFLSVLSKGLSFSRWWLIFLDVYMKFWIHQNDRNGRITTTIYDWLSMIRILVGVMITTIHFFSIFCCQDVSSNLLGFITIQDMIKIVSESLSQELPCDCRGHWKFAIVLKWHRFEKGGGAGISAFSQKSLCPRKSRARPRAQLSAHIFRNLVD